MQIVYLNPEIAGHPPEGWRFRTPFCDPSNGNWKIWQILPISRYVHVDLTKKGEFNDSFTYITDGDIPFEYLFDFDNTGLSLDDPFYKRLVKRQYRRGRKIQYLDDKGFWVPIRFHPIDWKDTKFRIDPYHAEDFRIDISSLTKIDPKKFIDAMRSKCSPKDEEQRLSVPFCPNLSSYNSRSFWENIQDEVKKWWVNTPSAERDFWNGFRRWTFVKSEKKSWTESLIYRPHFSQKDLDLIRDNEDFDKWIEKNPELLHSQGVFRRVFIAGRSTFREKS